MTKTLHIQDPYHPNFLEFALCGLRVGGLTFQDNWYAFKHEDVTCHACLDAMIRFAEVAVKRVIELDQTAGAQ